MDLPDSAVDSFKKAIWRVVEANAEAFTPYILGHANSLQRIHKRGVDCRTVIDVGASDGRWSQMARTFWPDAHYHLIEAFDHWNGALEALTANDPRLTYTLAAAGVEDGETSFTNSADDPFGGTAMPGAGALQWTVRQVSLDCEVERLGLEGPFLVKLDTHGTEREILAGARRVLENCGLLVIEMYNYGEDSRRFPAMCQHVESLGFHCIDMAEPMYRDHDRAFWQVDFFFVRKERPEAAYPSFR
ncbi:FkbM family methyltransferase [Azospirillum formosense]|uniref:FkbM family methyltransferase n=1 Tax=Azospirillum formosense TaxID=861533 RepID=A0ABX2KY87_9PROT|nr:FkbM family methyltransferase [Azospirillum formosense]MBY3757601.1 FkbM family methyltransferase [Azospirillum formosense]NUB21546.1 FkbM family methyltransferase [Azospirillum formosense]